MCGRWLIVSLVAVFIPFRAISGDSKMEHRSSASAPAWPQQEVKALKFDIAWTKTFWEPKILTRGFVKKTYRQALDKQVVLEHPCLVDAARSFAEVAKDEKVRRVAEILRLTMNVPSIRIYGVVDYQQSIAFGPSYMSLSFTIRNNRMKPFKTLDVFDKTPGVLMAQIPLYWQWFYRSIESSPQECNFSRHTERIAQGLGHLTDLAKADMARRRAEKSARDKAEQSDIFDGLDR